MQHRYRMYRRGRGSFYVKDRVTGKAESLGTADRAQAQHLLAARNQAVIHPQLNRAMARTYLSHELHLRDGHFPQKGTPARQIDRFSLQFFRRL